MSEIKVNSIKGVGASAAAITVNNTDGTCTANITNNLSNRRLTINGAMTISQRGTSFADPATGSYTLDRFNIQNTSGTPAFTVTQDTDAPHGFNNSLKVACTTADASPAAGSITRLRYKIEAQDLQPLAKGTSSAKASSLSFYVKTNKTGVYTVFVYDDDNNRMFSASYTVSDTNWNRYTIIIPADTTGAINDDNGTGFVIHWGLSLGSDRTSGSLASAWATYATANESVGNVNFADNTSNVWAITGVQLEVGSVATDFEHRSFGQERALCQRYFCAYGSTVDNIQNGDRLGCGISTGSNTAIVTIPTGSKLRAFPTVSFSSGVTINDAAGGPDVSSISRSVAYNGHAQIQFVTNPSSLTSGNAAHIRFGSTSYLHLSAEL